MKEVRSSDYGGWLTYYEYSAADQMVHEKHQNGTITYHGYDAAGRESLIHHRTGAAVKIENWNFTRDEVGNPTVINVDTGALTTTNRYFNYDQANRIAKEAWRTTTPTNVYAFNYSYDEAGNRIAKQRVLPAQTALYWEYDLADQLTKQKTGSVTRVYFYFDNNGNMSYEHDNNASAGRTYYDYDNRNLLTRVDFPGATATNYYEYNALGERTRKWDSTAAGQFSTWDGIDVIVEKNNALTTVNRYVKGYTPVAGIGAHVMIDPGASGRTWFVHKNQVGTTIKVTDNTGATQNSYQDDAWGQPFLATEGATYRFRFNGKELEPDFILFNSNNRRYHYPARTYVPFRGQFARFDPVLRDPAQAIDEDGIRRLLPYMFAGSNTLIHVDPFGLTERQVAFHPKAGHDVGAFAGWAKKVAGKDTAQFGTGKDIMDKLQEMSKNKDCIKSVWIFAHAWGWRPPGTPYPSGGGIPPDGADANSGAGLYAKKGEGAPADARDLEDLEAAVFNRDIVFCCDCEIMLTGCRTAATDFPWDLAKITNCTVTAARGASSPVVVDKKDSGTWSSGPKTTDEKKKEPYTGWVKYDPKAGTGEKLGKTIKVW